MSAAMFRQFCNIFLHKYQNKTKIFGSEMYDNATGFATTAQKTFYGEPANCSIRKRDYLNPSF